MRLPVVVALILLAGSSQASCGPASTNGCHTSFWERLRFALLPLKVPAAGGPTQVPCTAPVDFHPTFCQGLDCPEFRVLRSYGEVQLRRYKRNTWITTTVRESRFDKAVMKGFHRLFGYLLGYNEEAQKLEMTAPVLTSVGLDKRGDIKDKFNIFFFLPFCYQERPPKPAQEDVRVVRYPGMDVYVLPFTGYATGSRIRSLGREFVKQLRHERRCIVEDAFFVAQYDPPFKLLYRHNEIWVLKRQKRNDIQDCEDEDVDV